MRERIDENTGRSVYQITDSPEGSTTGYFRSAKHLPGGWILARGHPGLIMLHPDSGEVRPLPPDHGAPLGRNAAGEWLFLRQKRQLWCVTQPFTPQESARLLGELPEHHVGRLTTVTCDGRHVILAEHHDKSPDAKPPCVRDAAALWRFFNRPRHGKMWSYDLQTHQLQPMLSRDHGLFIHHDASPADPTLVRFAHDYYDAYCQRIWTVRVDGSELRPIRPQQRGEFVTHEFWWPGGQLIGYKYQDRRGDPTIEELPWAEYAPRPTRLGLAGLDGREVYLSDPLNHYHSHIYRSLDGALLCGEGTDGASFVYAARFSIASTQVEFVPHATIHTPYRPFAVGQTVNAGFSQDNRWLIFNDTLDGVLQICAVRVDL